VGYLFLASGWMVSLSVQQQLADCNGRDQMIPTIHGMGRIVFKRYDFTYLPVRFVSEIPNGPKMNEEFVREGATILLVNSEWHLPPVLVVAKTDDVWDKEYWVIEGRHRRESYVLADRKVIPVVVGTGMIVLP
jgi:hypothetical protein